MKTELSLTKAEVETIVKDHVASQGFEITGPVTFRPTENPGIDFCSMPVKIYHQGNIWTEKEKEWVPKVTLPANPDTPEPDNSAKPRGRGGSKASGLRWKIENKIKNECLLFLSPGELFDLNNVRDKLYEHFADEDKKTVSTCISNTCQKLMSRGVIERRDGEWYKL